MRKEKKRINVYMCIQPQLALRTIDFVAKPSKMGNRIAILIPVQFHRELLDKKLLNRYMKFHGEEILEQIKK